VLHLTTHPALAWPPTTRRTSSWPARGAMRRARCSARTSTCGSWCASTGDGESPCVLT